MPKEAITDFEYALLGLLSAAPMSGYDVKKAFATALSRFSPSSGGLYPALKRLERRGLLAARIDREGELRARRLYQLTEAGTAALDAWIRQPIDQEMVARRLDLVLLRFVYLEGRGTRAEAIAFLEQLRDEVARYLSHLEAQMDSLKPVVTLHQRLAAQNGVSGYRGQLAWVEYALAELRSAERKSS